MAMTTTTEELGGKELWRRQCARNMMDCYALGLPRLWVEGMTVVRDGGDEKIFYKMAAASCRECAVACGDMKGRLFRVYAALFDEMCGEEGNHG
jgi:hypothetical protein